ncbi:MAG: nucleotidyltransferase family protein [Candidatus Dormibacteria bacterium]
MTVAGLLLAAGGSSRFLGAGSKLLADFRGRPLVQWPMLAAFNSGCDEVAVVDGALDLSAVLLPGLILLHNPNWASGQATSLRLGIEWCRSQGHDLVLVALGDQPLIPSTAWDSVRLAEVAPITAASYSGRRGHPVRLAAEVWDLLPEEGDHGARELMRARPEIVLEVECPGDPADVDTVEDLERHRLGAYPPG